METTTSESQDFTENLQRTHRPDAIYSFGYGYICIRATGTTFKDWHVDDCGQCHGGILDALLCRARAVEAGTNDGWEVVRGMMHWDEAGAVDNVSWHPAEQVGVLEGLAKLAAHFGEGIETIAGFIARLERHRARRPQPVIFRSTRSSLYCEVGRARESSETLRRNLGIRDDQYILDATEEQWDRAIAAREALEAAEVVATPNAPAALKPTRRRTTTRRAA